MDLDVVFLGTSGSVPTPARGLTSVLIRRGGERLLLDCGEGTQRQLMRSVGLADIDIVMITHAHADHFLGLPGMLKTFSLRERAEALTIVGPPGFDALYGVLRKVFGRLSFPVDLQEAEPGWKMQRDGYVLESFETEHGVPSVGYRLREFDRPGRFDLDAARELGVPSGPAFGRLQRGESVELADGTTITPEHVLGETRTGRTIVFTGDTRACSSVRDAAADADLLIHEATFSAEEQERADQTMHCTAHDAAITAAAANVSMLAITHLSNRYTGRELVAEAREVFPEAVCPRDFDLIVVPYAERGTPELIKGGGRPERSASYSPEAAGKSAAS